MSDRTVFDDIVEDNIPSFKVWENKGYLAFLSPWPSTPGMTVVIPKKNPGSYLFDLDKETVSGLMEAYEKSSETP